MKRALAILLILAMTALPVQMKRFTFNNGGGNIDGDGVDLLASVGESITGRTDGEDAGIAAGFIVIESSEDAVDDDDDEAELVPDKFALLRATPNPFNSVCQIDFNLADDGDVEISITSVDGKRLLTEKSRMNRGRHAFTWHAENVESGVYMAGIKSGEDKASIKVILVK